MENIIDEPYISETTESSEEYESDGYDTETDEFLLHRNDDEVSAVMSEYEDVIKVNLYDYIDIKIRLSNHLELKRLVEFLIFKGYGQPLDIDFKTN